MAVSDMKRSNKYDIVEFDEDYDSTSFEKTITASCMNATCNINRFQSIRRKMEDCLFGLRVLDSECVFLTLSPNSRESVMIFRMSLVQASDIAWKRLEGMACFRTRCSIADAPKLYTTKYIVDCENVNVKDEKVQSNHLHFHEQSDRHTTQRIPCAA